MSRQDFKTDSSADMTLVFRLESGYPGEGAVCGVCKSLCEAGRVGFRLNSTPVCWMCMPEELDVVMWVLHEYHANDFAAAGSTYYAKWDELLPVIAAASGGWRSACR
jgi:hypothetical protein